MSEKGESHQEQPTHGHPANASLPFASSEWQEFHKDDVRTGTAVVSLLTGIFVFGLLLYLAVLHYVMLAPQIG
jgi:hypothetical protein